MKNVQDIYSLAPMQEMMLLHSVASTASDALVNQVVYLIDDALNVIAFQQAWQTVVERHPTLRTIFLWEKLKEPVQVVREQVQVTVECDDWRTKSKLEQELALNEFLAQQAQTGIALNKAPLMRLNLMHISDDVYYFVWTSHHLILDRWSIPIVMNDMQTAYLAYCAGETIEFPAGRSYRDYIAWIKTQDSDALHAYWQRELSGALPATLLHKNTQQQAPHPCLQTKTHQLDVDLVQLLHNMSKAHRLTLSTLMLGAWSIVHLAYCPEQDALLGITVSGRPPELAHVESIAGSFINNIPFRVLWSPDAQIGDWLQDIQQRQMEIQKYSHVSAMQLRSWRDIRDDANVFETLFLYQTPVVTTNKAFDMKVVHTELKSSAPLTLAVMVGENTLELQVVYDEAQYDATHIDTILAQLETTLRLLAYEHHTSLSSLVQEVVVTPRYVEIVNSPLVSERITATKTKVIERDVAPRNHIEEQIAAICSNILNIDFISIDDDFFMLGGNSLGVLRVIQQIKQVLGHEFTPMTFLQHSTVAELAQLVSETSNDVLADVADEAIVVLQRGDDSYPPLFMIHGFGGGVLDYMELVRHLPPELTVYGIQAASVTQIKAHHSFEQLALSYCEKICQIAPDGDVFIGGHSLGGTLAYEIGYQLSQKNMHRVQLYLFDAGPDPYREMSQLQRANYSVKRQFIRAVQHLNHIQSMGMTAAIDHYAKRFSIKLQKRANKRHIATMPVYDLENWHERMNQEGVSMQSQKWIAAAFYPLVENYYPHRASISTVIFYTHAHPQIQDLVWHWRQWFGDKILFEVITGDHVSIIQKPHVSILADRLIKHMNSRR